VNNLAIEFCQVSKFLNTWPEQNVAVV